MVVQAAHVDGGHGLARGPGAFAERRAAAGRAEMMLDRVLVEGVGGDVAFRRQQAQVGARHEPQEIAFPAADGAIALHRLVKISLGFNGDFSAVATTCVDHGFSSLMLD